MPLTHWEGRPVESRRAEWSVPTFEAYARIGSTNDRALELAARGRAFSVVIAEEQTEGRGRHGAHWHSPPGVGLWMSVALPSLQGSGHVPLLVGLSAARAIEVAGPELRVGIKWPNDLMIRGRKVGGILCESAGGAVVAGIGINVRGPDGGFPPPISERATALQDEAGGAVGRSALAGLIVGELKRRFALPTATLDPDALVELEARDVLRGRRVDTDPHGVGTAMGCDADGALILERTDGSHVRVLAGSVRLVYNEGIRPKPPR